MKRWRSYSADQWREWIAAQPESGQTVEVFCRKIGTSPQSFYRWRSKLAKLEPEDDVSAPGFIPLTVIDSKGVEIRLPCGATISMARDDEELRQVLGILLEFSPPC